MTDAAATREQFRRRWTALGLAETAVALPVDSTISPLTLPLAALGSTAPNEPAASLPRIAIELDTATHPETSRPADLALVSTLGEGGMGRVHLAQQRSLRRQVAVKMLKDSASPRLARALLEEARLTGSLEHPGVIPVHALGLDEQNRPLLVMKKIEGVEWRTLLANPDHPLWASRNAADRLSAGIEILIQVCQSVEFAHSRGVIHLDIKPENVMVGEYGEVYLVDWGIAKRLLDGSVRLQGLIGTPTYMAPEMVFGRPLDVRTDVYLLGATLHEMLTGRFRHEGATVEGVLLAAALSEPVRYDDSIPEALADLARRATSADPEQRPESAQAFREELLAFLRHRSAMRLSEIAGERLASLESLLLEPGSEPPRDLATAYRLATESRFGFTQSLDQYPALELAQRGLSRCIELSIELELRQEHAETARALLGELQSPDPTLVARIEAAEARALQRSHEANRLRAMERDLDPSQSRRPRAAALTALIVVMLSVAVTTILTRRMGRAITAMHMLVIAVVVAVSAIVAVFMVRKQILTTAFNRRCVALVALAISGAFVDRVVGLILDIPVERMVGYELIFTAVLMGAAAITMVPRLWWGAAVLTVGFIAVETWPATASRYSRPSTS